MTDDLDQSMKTDTGWMDAPKQWLHVPGGPMKTASWNRTLDQGAKTNILQSSYFQYLANLTAITYIPESAGELIIDVGTNQQLYLIT